ncbi:unnamed protein product [Zymoseptoria tritici ST99CH_3D1]|nr:unnamed protein product [Zymoseptoria tritici ST99CH_3D1]
MARLRRGSNDSGDFVPTSTRRDNRSSKTDATTKTTRRQPTRSTGFAATTDERTETSKLIPRVAPTPEKKKRQVRLAPLNGVQASLGSLSISGASERESLAPKRRAPRPVLQKSRSITKEPAQSDVESQVDFEESICCGELQESEDDSDVELPSLGDLLGWSGRDQVARKPTLPGKLEALSISREVPEPIKPSVVDVFDEDDQPPFKPFSRMKAQPATSSRPVSSSDKENNDAVLSYSPPRIFRRVRSTTPPRPITPPRSTTPPPKSPSKSRLQSPSKRKPRIPTPPLRPSLDAFWTAEAVNNWNDTYSPQKTLKSPAKKPPGPFDTPPLSPTKRTKSEVAERKTFESTKEAIASSFLAELDSTITNNQISALAASVGGVQLIWSNTLTTTAGRANWKRETTRTRSRPNSDKATGQDNTVTTITHKHHASIELSTKIIDNTDRLLNVVAHEFCHLANFMISNITDQPHGKSFKNWGRLVSKAFGDRGVEVTTNHSYVIEYKYIWKCEEGNGGCGREFGRHSKSVDPARHRCGGCKGTLVQVKPVPRKAPASGEGSGYAGYVKKHFAEVKKSLGPGVKHGDVMKALSVKYRAEKDVSVEGILNGLAGVNLGDSQSPTEVE